jgi:short-subunit dehydrogenase
MPDPDPARKVVLVTGASSGIGAALAGELAGRGCRLALTARRADRLESLADQCRRLGAEVVVLPADLGDTEVAAKLIGDTVAAFGRLDVLVNNAGYGLPSPFAEADPADIVRQLDVNLVTPILLAKYALPHLVASRGTVINVGSSLSTIAVPAYGVYGTTKMGMAYWNDALRREVRRLGVHVCLVEPGPVSTDFFDAAAGPTDAVSSPWQMLPPPFAKARPDDVARRIARLIDRPRRRLSVLRRVVWPMRIMGSLFRAVPALGDVAIGGLMRLRGRKRP